MTSLFRFIKLGGLLMATTVGAGIFALPYIFFESGWALGLAYLLFFGAGMALVHSLYWRVLVKVKDREGFLGLTRDRLGKLGFYAGFFSILGGLLLSQTAFLILAAGFLRLVVPGAGFTVSVVAFWLAAAAPILLGARRFVKLELFGGALMVLVVILIFAGSFSISNLKGVPGADWNNFFLPFGAILFSLAGWTAIEPMINFDTKSERFKKSSKLKEVFPGTFAVGLIYLAFVAAILASAADITPDTISGLTNWADWKLAVLGVFGLFSIWTSYLPAAFESRLLIEKDLNKPRNFSLALVVLLPVTLVFFGLTNFLSVVFLVGGVFLAIQYFLLILIARRVLDLGFKMKLATFIMAIIFLLGAVYEIYHFAVV